MDFEPYEPGRRPSAAAVARELERRQTARENLAAARQTSVRQWLRVLLLLPVVLAAMVVGATAVIYLVAGTQAAGVVFVIGCAFAVLAYASQVITFLHAKAPILLVVLGLVVVGLVWSWATTNLHFGA